MRTAALASVLLLGACSSVTEIPANNRADVVAFMTQLEEGERTWSTPEIEASLGPPVQHDSSATETHLVWYGLELTLAGAEITQLAFTDARHISPEGLRVGYAATHVRRGLGPPLVEEEGQYTYVTENGTRMIISLEDGQVVRAEWHYGASGQ